jgi:hypothetical protein
MLAFRLHAIRCSQLFKVDWRPWSSKDLNFLKLLTWITVYILGGLSKLSYHGPAAADFMIKRCETTTRLWSQVMSSYFYCYSISFYRDQYRQENGVMESANSWIQRPDSPHVVCLSKRWKSISDGKRRKTRKEEGLGQNRKNSRKKRTKLL